MATGKNNHTKSSAALNGAKTAGATTRLPGVNNAQVIVSSPNMIKENKQISTRKK